MKTVNWNNAVPRAVLGGALGLQIGLILIPYFMTGTRSPSLAVCLLCTALGAAAGVATLPFADDGRSLVLRSLAHFAVTAALFALLIWTLGGNSLALLAWDALLALLYVLIWLGRWVGWYSEVAEIRRLLGLDPGPSPLKWRETLPHFLFALLLCDGLPLFLRLVDARDVPVLCGIFLPYLLLPVAGFTSGLSLGKRRGFCPLYPLACALFYLPIVFLLFNSSALFHCGMVGVPALAGNVLGATLRRRRQKM